VTRRRACAAAARAWAGAALVLLAAASGCRRGTPLGEPASEPAAGPLRVDSANPRYFTSGRRAVLLAGAHTWTSLQDAGSSDPPPPFDYDAYLRFLVANGHNFFRLWMWEQAEGSTEVVTPYWFAPLPWARTGPGLALDGKPRFDLTRFDDAYFRRMRARVQAAGRLGIYVSIMLFDGWSVEPKNRRGGNPWRGHPFNRANNVNGIDGDPHHHGEGKETQTLQIPAVTAVQEAYVRHVVDVVDDLDNVLYEISNESDTASTAWEDHMVEVIKRYEAGKPKQHPVGMSVAWPGGSNAPLYAGPADWISPNGDANRPPVGDGRKVVVWDTDHLCGICTPRGFAWKALLSGLNPLLMDPYTPPDTGMGVPGDYRFNDRLWQRARRALGYARSLASRVDLAAMRPRPDLASSGYCLAHPAGPGAAYLVYAPDRATLTVDLSQASGRLAVAWLRPDEGILVAADSVSGGAAHSFRAPFGGDAVLYIHDALAEGTAHD